MDAAGGQCHRDHARKWPAPGSPEITHKIDIVEGRASPPTAVANPTLRRERAFVEGTGVLGSSRYQLYTDTAVRSVRGSQA